MLAARGVTTSIATLWRFFARHGITRKKRPATPSEQDRPDVLKRREEWFEGQLDLDPDRLVFIDETWASTNMARRHGRCRRGQRLRAGIPFGHWKTTTFTAGTAPDRHGCTLGARGADERRCVPHLCDPCPFA